jgi:dipeptidyl aminopeptidase/acylaminoacyl peptidase
MKKALIILISVSLFSCTSRKTPEVTRYSIEQFYQNTRYQAEHFSEDESKLLISSDETGIFNVFELDIQTGEKKQITHSNTESCFVVDYVYGTDEILYSADRGGNENDHIYLMKKDGTITDLTPGDNVKAQAAGWSKDRQILYYVSNKRDPRFFDLYMADTRNWKEKMLYKNEKGFEISVSTRDRSILVLRKPITTSLSHLFLLYTATGEMKEVSEPGKPGLHSGTGFSNDNRYLYYTTNAGSEFSYLVSYEISSGNRETIYETGWDVSYSFISENEKYRALFINEDAKIVMKIFEIASGKEVSVPVLQGSNLLNASISESEKKLMMVLGSSKTTGDIYIFNFGDNALKKLTRAMNPEINQDDLISAEVVRYRSFDSLEIPAIFYKPLAATRRNKVPALVLVHGGPGGQSTVSYAPLIQYLVNHGYAILAVNNRGSSGYGKTFYRMDDQNHGDMDLKDCIWGKKWLQTLDYIEKDKIGIIGGSYGGFMTMAAMAFASDEFRVGVNFFGVTNWLRTLKSVPPYWESFRDALYSEMGNPFTADSVRLYNISPLFHAGNIRNPVMVLQGANDPRVLQVESDEMVAAIKANNVPVEYIIFPDEGHGFIKKENEIKANGEILEFLDKYLRGENEE